MPSSTTPAGPDGLPILGNTVDFIRNQEKFYNNIADEYEEIIPVTVSGIGEYYLVTSPELVEEMLITERDSFGRSSQIEDLLGELLGDGLLLSEGDFWQKQRSAIQPAFYRDQIATYSDRMVNQAERTVATWEPGETYDIEAEMKDLTLRILTASLFGSDFDYEEWGIREITRNLQAPGRPKKQPVASLVPKWVPIPMWKKYNRALADLESIIEYIITRSGQLDDDNLISSLLDEDMTEEQVRDEMMNLLFAGHETTALALTYTWYLLANHPIARGKLHEEVDTVLDGASPEMADLQELTYTKKVVKESLRLYPPIPAVVRESTTSVTLGDYTIPEGSLLHASQWMIHHDEALYANPYEFVPERWTDELEADSPRFAYFPFGGGPKKCIGAKFAMIELQLIVATIAQYYDLHATTNQSLDLSMSVSLFPLTDIVLEAVPRKM